MFCNPGEASWCKKTSQQIGIYLGDDKNTMRQFLATWQNAKKINFPFFNRVFWLVTNKISKICHKI
jgi:hypothetical protein